MAEVKISYSERYNSKILAFVAMMGALGNTLFVLTGPLSTLSAGFVNVSIDLSHVATVIAAIFSGPIAGGITGLIIGVAPGIWFGMATGPVALICLPIGKALTGLSIGLLQKSFRIHERKRQSLITIVLVLVGYIPESLFTIAYFLLMIPYFTGYLIASAILVGILVKGWIELTIIGVLSGSLIGNKSFTGFIVRLLKSQPTNK